MVETNTRLRRHGELLTVLPRLGLGPIAAALAHRSAKRYGVYRRALPTGTPYAGPFLKTPSSFQPITHPHVTAMQREFSLIKSGMICYFGHQWQEIGNPPRWFFNPLDRPALSDTAEHWSRYREFQTASADIKKIWEASRFSWLLMLARYYRSSGDQEAVLLANSWLEDWVANNPFNRGPNWMCGQETALRVFMIALAVRLTSSQVTPALERFFYEHCSRIYFTHFFACALKNNHATSEAGALYAAGALLSQRALSLEVRRAGQRWMAFGLARLERYLRAFIASDGSFTQRSTNYHRLMLDTASLTFALGKHWGAPLFSSQVIDSIKSAVTWLYSMVHSSNGRAPLLGGNDGALLLPTTNGEYLDFRPSLQLASHIFCGTPCYPPGPWDEWPSLLCSEEDPSEKGAHSPTVRTQFPEGGYYIIASGNIWALLHAPRGDTRPLQADALHLDVWVQGINILPDAGTYLYHDPNGNELFFPSSQAHNTLTFDGRNQMPQVGTFLYSRWLRCRVEWFTETADGASCCVSYQDYRGCTHRRTVEAAPHELRIYDEFSGARKHATLRWHLGEGLWKCTDCGAVSDYATLTIESKKGSPSITHEQGWYSPYYAIRRKTAVLSATISTQSGCFETVLRV